MSTTDPEQMAQPGAAARTGLIGYFAGNPVAANLLMLVLVAGGIASGYRLAVQQFPEIDLRTVTVTVRFPGASPQEVEQDINRRVEESVIGLAGVERVVTAATEGLARIRIELATFAAAGSVLTDVRNAVDAIENFPPRNAGTAAHRTGAAGYRGDDPGRLVFGGERERAATRGRGPCAVNCWSCHPSRR